MWKGRLEIGAESVPVKLYAAVDDGDVHFRLLHAADKAPVRQHMVDPRTEREVPTDAIRRGAEIEPGVYVALTPAEVERDAPAPSRAIEVLRFVAPSAIDPVWYDRPYFLGPDGSAREYAALVDALSAGDLCGVAKWVMRDRRYFGALRAHGRHLALITLHRAHEVVPAELLPVASGREATPAEHRLAEQLVAALEGPFDPAMLRDDYRERVLAHVAAKAKGRRLRPAREPAPRPSGDLERALARSVRQLRRRRAA